jgi:hypothetical protein
MGVGKVRAIPGLRALIESERPTALLSLGFAGALREGLLPGDVVLCQRIYSFSLTERRVAPPLESDDGLLQLADETARGLGIKRLRVDSVTVSEAVLTSSKKSELASETPGWVVDMEGYWIGLVASEAGIPFLAVRAILDTARQELPPFVVRLADMGPAGQPILAFLFAVTRPWHIPTLIALGRQARQAQAALTSFAMGFLARRAAPNPNPPVRAVGGEGLNNP